MTQQRVLRVRFVMSTLVLLILGTAVSTVMAKQDESLPGESLIPTAHGDNIWFEYACVEIKCPAGFLRDGNKNFVGCVAGQQSCSGECFSCAGSATLSWMCKRRAGEACVWPNTMLGPAPCGNKSVHTCTYSAITPPQFDTNAPNGCYCTGPGTGLGLVCYVAQCI